MMSGSCPFCLLDCFMNNLLSFLLWPFYRCYPEVLRLLQLEVGRTAHCCLDSNVSGVVSPTGVPSRCLSFVKVLVLSPLPGIPHRDAKWGQEVGKEVLPLIWVKGACRMRAPLDFIKLCPFLPLPSPCHQEPGGRVPHTWSPTVCRGSVDPVVS